MKGKNDNWWIMMLSVCFMIVSCKNDQDAEPMFEVLEAGRTGLKFENKLTPTNEFNLFDYMYYYNGAGVGAGDFNNDGLVDLYFAANQGANKIYLNKGNLAFDDITTASGIPQNAVWSTGVSIADVNGDGFLDIYVSGVGNYLSLQSKNQLLICQGLNADGIPIYKDEARAYGLDYSGFSTQAAFLDYDMDGDLDMFLLNHSVHENGVYRPRREFLGIVHAVAGARMFRNDGARFTDVTAGSGINSSVIGYGLGIAVSDLNLDGYPDIYIGNDFHENDYLYINNGKGVFKDEMTDRTGHSGRFTMGVDIADLNNDGHNEIISMDMLSDDPYILKRSLGEDDYDIFNLKISYGYQHQYTRNNLQLNRGNGQFTEAGLYAGVAATDWSWSPLFMDFDNDGLKDLFISNGIPKRMNDIDYINFVSNEEMQKKLAPGSTNDNNLQMIEKFPKIRIPNKFFSNKGQLRFDDIATSVSNPKETYSNGAVYADFDNDGDLDIVVNNIDAPALLYQNLWNSRQDSVKNNYISLSLKGDTTNLRALGSKVFVYSNESVQLYEKFPVHGFQSSAEIPVHIGLGSARVDSILVVWPDNTYELLQAGGGNKSVNIRYRKGLPGFNYAAHFASPLLKADDVSDRMGMSNLHRENIFAEFNRESLIPHMLSTEGPALAQGDFNGDGLQDVFIGGSRGNTSSIWVQQAGQTFRKSKQPSLDNDSIFEDVSACWLDVNGDGKQDLVVASGGNEFFGTSQNLAPRLYLNEDGQLVRKKDAFGGIVVTASVVVSADFNSDGFPDLFIGGRTVPMDYGTVPSSFLLMNNGKGNFTDVTSTSSKDLKKVGFVTGAAWADIDKDGDPDLLISREWGELLVCVNTKGNFAVKQLAPNRGWWNFVLPVDIDNDGDTDIIAGNLGLNSRLKASAEQPVRMYHYDFDDNGRKEQVLSYYVRDKEIPFASLAELSKQMPFIKKKFLYAGDFAKASLKEIFGDEKLEASTTYSADYFSNAVLINNGDGTFETRALPWQAQLSMYRDAVVIDANQDSLPDIMLAGNYFDSNTEMGRYDGDAGTILINRGKGNFSVRLLEYPWNKRLQTRHLASLKNSDKRQLLLLANNNDSTKIIAFPSFRE